MDEAITARQGSLIGKFLVGAGVSVAVTTALYAYCTRYSLTMEDRKLPLLGDDYLNGAQEAKSADVGMAIDIDAKPDLVWAHVKQMGQDRAGWYSFETLERLCTFDIHNRYTIHPEWQHRQVGQFLWYHQPPLGIGSHINEYDEEKREMGTASDSRITPTVPGSIYWVPPFAMDYFCWTWNFAAVDLGNDKTRLITKVQVGFEPFDGVRKGLVAILLGIPSSIMCSHMLNVVKRVCEGRFRIDSRHI